MYQPDIIFIAKENRYKIKENGFYGAPDLIIEILSPSTAVYDRTEKKEMYEHYGVREYWMVDSKEKMAEGYVLKQTTFQEPSQKIELQILDLTLEI